MDLDNQFVVIDTSEIGKDLLAAGTFTATDFCTETASSSSKGRTTLMWELLRMALPNLPFSRAKKSLRSWAVVFQSTQLEYDWITTSRADLDTLPEGNTQIFTSKYKLYLPTEEELRQELQREYQALDESIETK